MSELQDKTHRAVLTCSLLLHTGYVGAATVAAGLIQLFARETSWTSALALILFGGTLAVAGWQRARMVVPGADRAPRGRVNRRALDRPGPLASSQVELRPRAELG